MKKTILTLLAVLLFFTVIPAGAVDISENEPDSASDWYVYALIAAGPATTELSQYAEKLEKKLDGGVANADKPRIALLCAALGIRRDFVSETIADNSLNNVSAIIWRLVLAEEKNDISSLTEALLSLKHGEGWSLRGDIPDVDLTAMAAAALAHHGYPIDETITYLSSVQCESGGYESEYGRTSESCAQVIIALTIAGINPRVDERFIKNGSSVVDAMRAFRTDDGYSHTAGGTTNRLSTAQCMMAEAALVCLDRSVDFYEFKGIDLTPVGNTETQPRKQPGYKVYAIIIVVAVTLLVFAFLLIGKRAGRKNLVILSMASLICVLLIVFTNIQTVSQYYSENPDTINENSQTAVISVVAGDTVYVSASEYALREGETALDLLERVAKYNKLSLDVNGRYVRGIGGLYEFDRGSLSGWTVRINGEYLKTGADSRAISHGDRIEWVYTEGGLT